jgi:hypothetical protein
MSPDVVAGTVPMQPQAMAATTSTSTSASQKVVVRVIVYHAAYCQEKDINLALTAKKFAGIGFFKKKNITSRAVHYHNR